MPDAGYRMPDAGCRMQDTERGLLVAGYWLLRINLKASYKWVSCGQSFHISNRYVLF